MLEETGKMDANLKQLVKDEISILYSFINNLMIFLSTIWILFKSKTERESAYFKPVICALRQTI